MAKWFCSSSCLLPGSLTSYTVCPIKILRGGSGLLSCSAGVGVVRLLSTTHLCGHGISHPTMGYIHSLAMPQRKKRRTIYYNTIINIHYTFKLFKILG